MENDMACSMAEAWEDALEKWMSSIRVVEVEEITITQEEWDYIEDWKWYKE